MSKTVITCGTLIDGLADEPLQDADIVVENGIIQAVGPSESVDVPNDAAHIDHSDQVVTPGFIDLHVHLNGTRSFQPMERIEKSLPYKAALGGADLRQLLGAGFTTVRDTGGTTAIGLRNAVEDGEIPGPRIYAAGRAISRSGGHSDMSQIPSKWAADDDRLLGVQADGVAECRKKARQELRNGADLIKITITGGMASKGTVPDQVHYTDAETQAFAEEAHLMGTHAAAHAYGTAGINAAIRNGIDTIEHAIGFGEHGTGVDLAREHGTVIVPTLSAIYRLAYEGDDHGLPEYHVQKGQQYVEKHAESVSRAYEAGIPVALGTDCNGSYLHPHGDNAIEFELLVQQGGMDEMDALKAGTSVAADAIDADDIGAITPGRSADFVVLDENPLVDISATRDAVSSVYKAGERVDHYAQ